MVPPPHQSSLGQCRHAKIARRSWLASGLATTQIPSDTEVAPLLAKWPIRNKLLIGISLLLVIVTILSYSGFHGLYATAAWSAGLSRRVYELPLANEFSHV